MLLYICTLYIAATQAKSFHEQKKNSWFAFVKVSNIDFLFRLQFSDDHLVRMDVYMHVIMLRFFYLFK